MNIAVQCAQLSRRGGGLPAAIWPVAERLVSSAGVTLVTADRPEDNITVPIVRLRKVGPLIGGGGRALARIAPDIVHTHGLWTPLSAAALAFRRRTGRPTIVSPHGMLDPWAMSNSGAKKRLALALFERAHVSGAVFIHALNSAEAEAIRAAGIRASVAIVPNGVDSNPRDAPAPDFMDRPTLLFLGRITPKKGVSELIAAFARAAPRLPGWRLAIAGWDDRAGNVRSEATATGADIVFPGPLFGEAKAAAFANAAAFVLPSHSEGLPMTVLEAWAAGTPVLMSAACNLPEGFAAGAAAEIPLDPLGMADVLTASLSDAGWRAAAGAAGERLVRNHFSWDDIAETFLALYEYALGLGPRPTVLHD